MMSKKAGEKLISKSAKYSIISFFNFFTSSTSITLEHIPLKNSPSLINGIVLQASMLFSQQIVTSTA